MNRQIAVVKWTRTNILHYCPTRFPYQMMFVSFNSIRTSGTCGTGTSNLSGTPKFITGFKEEDDVIKKTTTSEYQLQA
jgi:hypothetical protein